MAAVATAVPEAEATAAAEADALPVDLPEVIGDAEGFFQVRYPSAWLAGPYQTGLRLWADDSGNTGLDVMLEIKAVSALALAEEYSLFFAETLDDYEEGEWEATTLDDYLAVYVPQTYSYNGVPQQGFMTTVVRNRVGWLLLGYAAAADYEQSGPVLEAMAQSLDITEFDDAPPYDSWALYEGEVVNFHYLPETYVAGDIEAIAAAHEDAFDYNAGWLGLGYEGPPVELYFYPSEEALNHATGRGSGFAINSWSYGAAEVHTIWTSADDHQSIGHELTHVLTYWSLGDAGQALLGEGTAVCLDHNPTPVHVLASELMATDSLLPLAAILDEAWFEQDAAIVYPQSGSVACWLLERYGAESFQQLFVREDFEAALEDIYGFDLDYLETDWLTMLAHS
jgi:hypothetical protein